MARLTTIICIISTLLSEKKNDPPPFTTIVFHTTGCFGACPVYHLELNNNRKIRLFAESVYNTKLPLAKRMRSKDSTKIGYFTGYATRKSFQKLLKIINETGLDTIKYQATFCCDAPVKTIIVYQHNKRIYLKSMFLPENINPLTQVLYEICEKSKLKRTRQKFEIESGVHIDKSTEHPPIEINNQTNR